MYQISTYTVITLIKTAKKKGTPYPVRELTDDSFFDLKPLAVGNLHRPRRRRKVEVDRYKNYTK